MTKVSLLLPIILISWVNAFTQASSTASASATLVEPITITKSIDKIAGGDGEVIIISAKVVMTSVGNSSKVNKINLPATSGLFTAASFSFSGLSGYSYAFTVPSVPTIFKNGSKMMEIESSFDDSTLNAGKDMVAGVFVSVTPYNVTVNYN